MQPACQIPARASPPAIHRGKPAADRHAFFLKPLRPMISSLTGVVSPAAAPEPLGRGKAAFPPGFSGLSPGR